MESAKLWKREIMMVSNKIDRNFKFIFDNYGYQPESITVHKYWRGVTPLLLGKFGLIQSLLSNAEQAIVKNERDDTKPFCYAAALVHHDKHKMDGIEAMFGTAYQKYFHDYKLAFDWITVFAKEN